MNVIAEAIADRQSEIFETLKTLHPETLAEAG